MYAASTFRILISNKKAPSENEGFYKIKPGATKITEFSLNK